MSQFRKTHLVAVAFLLAVSLVHADMPLFLPGGARTLHLTGVITNNNVNISWPVIPGNWELMLQRPADTGDWQPIAQNLYHTNGATVIVTQAIRNEPSLYRLRRVFPKISSAMMPPMPQAPTNRITPRPK